MNTKKTYILLLNNRQLLERIEGQTFKNENDLIAEVEKQCTNEEIIETFGYYEIGDFTELVNDQVLDNLTNTFISFVFVGE